MVGSLKINSGKSKGKNQKFKGKRAALDLRNSEKGSASE
jgi:hypothetical protein